MARIEVNGIRIAPSRYQSLIQNEIRHKQEDSHQAALESLVLLDFVKNNCTNGESITVPLNDPRNILDVCDELRSVMKGYHCILTIPEDITGQVMCIFTPINQEE